MASFPFYAMGVTGRESKEFDNIEDALKVAKKWAKLSASKNEHMNNAWTAVYEAIPGRHTERLRVEAVKGQSECRVIDAPKQLWID